MPANLPLYRVVADQILSDIRSGKLQPGDRIPAIRELEAETSNATARNAIRWLRDAGWVATGPGSAGTVVADPLPDSAPTLEERVAELERWRAEHEAKAKAAPLRQE